MTMAEQLSHLAGREVSNPDAQATITDFIDYTEFLSSDLLRSLTLISTLDQTYKRDAHHVHELTKTYGRLPTLPADRRPEPQQLRRQISLALDHATACRESTFAEASRLYDTITRLYDRLSGIKKTLMAMPTPPSRDSSPAATSRSPVISRTRKPETERIPRLKLFVDGGASGGHRRHSAGTATQKPRVRRLIVPGEVLPPRDLISPEPSSSSERESSAHESDSSVATPAATHHKKEKSGTQAASRLVNPVKLKLPKVTQPRISGTGTNAHSSVAGISTSNAIALLERPPENARPGSVYRPWLKLTEYEMAMLRKKMKKNAIWHPSATMVRRELQARGRGMENYRRARAHADATGTEFLDEDPLTTGSTILAPGEMTLSVDELSITNRGMKLNEAKKLKRENLMREQAAKDAAEIEEAERRISAAGLLVQNLFSHRYDVSDTIRVNAHQMLSPSAARSHKRKRRSSTDAGVNGQAPQTAPKRLRIGLPATFTTSTTTKVPLAPPGPSDSPLQKLSLRTPREKAIIAAGIRTAPAKLRLSASAEPSASGRSTSPSRERTPKLTLTLRTATTSEDSSRRSSLRKGSSTALSSDESVVQSGKAAGSQPRSKKRVDPVLAELEHNSPAPNRIRLSGGGKKGAPDMVGVTDPDEPRYCICGGVSEGDMVACDNDNCKMEWFHWGCVGLTQSPGRREKWFCPPCRKALGVDVHGIPVKKQKSRK